MRPALAILGGVLAAVAVASPARAGSYVVRSCGSSSSAAAFVAANTFPSGLDGYSQCPVVPTRRMTGIVVTSTGSNAQHGATAGWTLTAPAGTSLRRLDVQRAFQKWDKDWGVAVKTIEGTILETCDLGGTQVSCGKGIDPGTQAAAYTDLQTRGVSFGLECLAAHQCAGGTTPIQAWISVYSAVATIDDPAPPLLQPLAGTLLTPGWHADAGSVDLGASDASGIKTLTLSAGSTTLYEQQQSCDYSRMQPCPASKSATVTPDTSALADGTYAVRAVATDAADQPSVATAVLRIDRHAPEKPIELAVERNPDATLAFVWRNPEQGVAAPISAARYEVCDSAGANCVAGEPVTGENVARLPSVAVPAGEHVVRVWLQDAAGHADPATAATLVVDPTTISARQAVGTNPPALRPDDAPSPGLRVTRARRSGSTLTLSGTIARRATATISAKVSRQRNKKSLASGKAKPKAGKWTVKVRLTSALRRAGAVYVTVTYAGQQRYRKATLQRRVSK